ncbi:MAG: hypothetical protein K5928_05740 [Prevotella sp.]|nr:hypothetical protein [Prevotella sp.]
MYPRRRLITLLLTAVLSAFFACTYVADETETTEAELTATDTTYQRLRQQVAQIYYQTDQDYKAMDRAVGQLRRHCSSHGYDDGYYRAYADQILYYKNGMNFYYAEQLIDKMLEQLRRRPNDTGQQLLLYLMGSYYSVRGMDDKAEHYLLESVDYAEAHQADTDLWLVYYELANLYLGRQRYHEGMQAADRAIQAAEKTGTFQTACYSVKCQLAYRLNDGPTLNETYSRMQHLMERNHTADDDFSYYARAMHASMNGRVDEALALADSVSAIDGAQLKSELLARAGRWNEALEYETDNNWRIDSLNSFGFGEQAASLSADMEHTILEANARQARQLWVSKLSLALAALAVLMAIILYVYVSQRRKRASQLRRLNERLYAAKREAEQDIQAKSIFIHHIGKDIRQPLDEIGQVAQRVAVADSMTDDDKRREADVMSRSITRITDIVNRAIKAVSLVALLLTLGCGSPTLQPDVADTVTGEDASRLPRQSRELLPDEYQTLDSLRRRVA